jgi:ComEC/Rec2-related protein
MIRSHPSVFLLGFVVAGIVLADHLPLFPQLFLLLGACCFGVTLLFILRGRRLAGAVLACVAVGLVAAFSFRMHLTGFGSNHLRQLVTSPAVYEVFGRAADWPEFRGGRTETVLEIDSLSWRGQSGWVGRHVDGRLLLKVTDTTTALQRGDRVAFRARLYPILAGERHEFPYARYLNLRGIFAQVFLPTMLNVRIDRRPTIGFISLIDGVRSAIRSSLERNLSPPASALARGFLIGETRDISPDIYRLFRDSGTLHLLAVSGSNVALVLLFAIWVMRPFWLGVRSRSVLLLAVIAVFAGLSYGEPSVMRASVMAALIIGARLLGRTYDLNNVIASAALLILLVDPGQLFDVGFQLSFVTAWGLIFFVPRLAALFTPWHERTWYRWLALPVIIALVAQIVSTPVVAYCFDRVPVFSVVANLIVVPIVSLAVIGVLILLTVDLIWPLMGSFIGSIVDIWMRGLLAVLQWVGGENVPIIHPGLLVDSPFTLPAILTIYLLLVVLALGITSVRARRLAVILGVTVTNAVLAVAVGATLVSADSRIVIERVPGGVATIICRDNTVDPDLIITGLSRQSYPLDERVLQPLLRRHGYEGLSRLIVLDADYNALKDVLRLSAKLAVDTVYAGRGLAASIEDIHSQTGESAFQTPVVFFSGQPVQVEQGGYFLSEDRVTWRQGDSQIDVVDQVRLKALTLSPLRSGGTLVIGRQWYPAAEDWIRLRQAGYERIVCAEIEQPRESLWPDTELGLDALPDYLHDLSRSGPMTFHPER